MIKILDFRFTPLNVSQVKYEAYFSMAKQNFIQLDRFFNQQIISTILNLIYQLTNINFKKIVNCL